jgi:hypothetical protein
MKRKKAILYTCLCIILISTGYVFWGDSDPLQAPARREWKERSLREISARISGPGWATNEITRLKAIKSDDPDSHENWLSTDLILLQNGEWLAFKNVCRKEDGHIHDLFLAKASDGKWYYSTYHFCRDMISLKMELQPKDLASFTNYFSLQSFDGKSDECLKQTWPPKSP